MDTGPIVEDLYVFRNQSLGRLPGRQHHPVDEFILQSSKERFSQRIIPTHAGTTHRTDDSQTVQMFRELGRRVLTKFNQSMQHRYFLEIVAVR